MIPQRFCIQLKFRKGYKTGSSRPEDTYPRAQKELKHEFA